MQQQTAAYLVECQLDEQSPQPPLSRDEVDLGDYHEEGEDPEVVFVPPAPVSGVSVAIERALREEGVTYAALARRMGVPRSVVTRITNPFYFAHATRTLRAVARALGREMRVTFERPQASPERPESVRGSA
ncbi:MAG: helix-turn-helix transcriptional regulator [Trueperaceae bacterium]|nr:helix-turn-helix transcriptional regulator [Trueperaceae bacterium]